MSVFSARSRFTLEASRYYSYAIVGDPSLNLHQILHLSISHQSLKLIQQSHAQLVSLGFTQNPFLATKLISAYAICGNPIESQLVFYSVLDKNVYLWNSVINGYVKNCQYNAAFGLFKRMCYSNISTDDYTLATMSKVTGELGELNAGKSIHGRSMRIGSASDVVVANSLMAMYCKCGEFGQSWKLFGEMPQRNVGSWNVILSGYVDSGYCNFDKEVWGLVRDMRNEGLKPDSYTVSSLMSMCRSNYGRELHCFIVRNELDLGFGSDDHLGCCLIDMYSRNNKIVLARQIFDRMEHRNVHTCTAIINGYVQNGVFDEALVLFRVMQLRDGVEPNKVSLVSAIPACSSFAHLMGGKQIHGFAIRRMLNHDVSLSNALINMYSKSGILIYARGVFEDGSFCKDTITWSSMISGYGLHGKGEEAILLYDKMLQLGSTPDMITVVGVLSACGRSGLVNEGLNIFNSAINEHGVKPTVEICSCVVDILGRSGQLDQALDFIRLMPVEPGPSVWGALVSASVMHGNLEMLDVAYRFLIQLEPDNPSNYVSLSNSHASSRRWDVVAEVRKIMKERGLKKAPGCSCININGKSHCFHVADKAHPCAISIYEMLDNLITKMRGAGISALLENLT
ncbi:PPR_2 domain-containing protein [Cephalotus follicularis]|uniref:PPR_2 domain-containing protein n=1 Tax=Cephalotus follicularis TaxID=3775 RepID=A0A1Q3D4Q3_CEPFO|nr:PPR_2 domain-containing protein [Cephalotus follicularis]